MQLAPFFLIRYPSKAAPSPSILPMKLQKKCGELRGNFFLLLNFQVFFYMAFDVKRLQSGRTTPKWRKWWSLVCTKENHTLKVKTALKCYKKFCNMIKALIIYNLKKKIRANYTYLQWIKSKKIISSGWGPEVRCSNSGTSSNFWPLITTKLTHTKICKIYNPAMIKNITLVKPMLF